MFHKVQLKLSFICCLSTTLIVLVIILCCLNVSEKKMYDQEKALFLLKINTISSDLYLSESIDINWYIRNLITNKNILYIEVNGTPATLSSLILSDKDFSLISDIKKYLQNKEINPYNLTNSSNINQKIFEYALDNQKFLVSNTKLYKSEQEITYIYLYSLEDFYFNVKNQRILFFGIWFFSILILYLFSHIFTLNALKPVIQNDEKQRHFIAFASHELRSPLAVFKTGLSVLKNKPDPQKTERIFSLMENEMSRMERLIQDLLCLTKFENAKLNFDFECVNLADLLKSVHEKYVTIAKQKNITLSLSISGNCSYDCLCDRQRMEQAIIILLDNALSYTPSGQNVSLNIYCSHKKYYIQVIDTGIGISDSDKEKIFDKFYQVDSSRKHKEHFGLGLSIAKEICYSHGGKISVNDTKGGGSTFTITLPLRKLPHYKYLS